jgi:hypothetical protein
MWNILRTQVYTELCVTHADKTTVQLLILPKPHPHQKWIAAHSVRIHELRVHVKCFLITFESCCYAKQYRVSYRPVHWFKFAYSVPGMFVGVNVVIERESKVRERVEYWLYVNVLCVLPPVSDLELLFRQQRAHDSRCSGPRRRAPPKLWWMEQQKQGSYTLYT